MSPKRPPNNTATARRRSVRARRVGIGKECKCGENRPEALIAGSRPTICAECKRMEEGRSIYDKHHVAGKANDPTMIPVPANDHMAILSEEQRNWPKRTLENPERDPLLVIAARNRGLHAIAVYLIEKLLLDNPPLLEKLSLFLNSRLGPKWFEREEFTNFTQGDS